jgi:hypothetical protein
MVGMTDIRLRFVAEKDLVSGLIEYFTGGSQWCHVEFLFDADEQKALGLSGPYVGAHASGGVEAYDDSYYVGGNTIIRARAYSIPMNDDQYRTITSFIKTRIGTKYDFKDILGLMLHQSWHEDNATICSAFLIAALWSGGVRLLNILPQFQYKTTPEMAHLSPLLIGRELSSYSIG